MFFIPNYGIKIITESYTSFSTRKEIVKEKSYIVILSGTDIHKEVFFTNELEDAEYVRDYLQNKLNKQRESK